MKNQLHFLFSFLPDVALLRLLKRRLAGKLMHHSQCRLVVFFALFALLVLVCQFPSTAQADTRGYAPPTATLPSKQSTPTPALTRLSSRTVSTVSDFDWVTRGNMAEPRAWGAAASCNGKIYAAGGILGNHNFTAVPNPFEEYDPATDLWRTKASMSVGRTELGMACLNGKLYAVGGRDPVAGGDLRLTEEYDPATNTWRSRAAMLTARDYPAVAAGNGKIYAIGGTGLIGGNSVNLATVEEYDPAFDTWQGRTSMPTPGALGAATASNGRIYVAVGNYTNGVYTTLFYEYDPLMDNWQTKASVPTARSQLAVTAASNGLIYAIGGWGQSPASYSAVEQYDPSSDSWQTKASMPTPRYALAAAAVETRIFAVGGTPGLGSLATVEEYDTANNRWISHGSSMPTARAAFGVASSGGKLYAIGGYVQDTNGTRTDLATVEEYDPTTNLWQTRANMPTPREGAGVIATSSGSIYVIGGIGSAAALSVVEEYSPATNSWRARTSMPTARGYFGVTLGSDGKIYTIGGWGPTSTSSVVEAYDPATDSWQARANLRAPRSDLAATAINGRIYAIGGNEPNESTTVEEYDPVTNTWRLRAYMPTARADLTVVAPGNGKVYALGGYSYDSYASRSIFWRKGEEYDPATDTWSERASLPIGLAVFGISLADNGRLYAIGGACTDDNIIATIHETAIPPQAGYAIYGLVRDNSGNRLAGVSITTNTGATAISDAEGYFAIPSLTPATYTLTSSKTGYSFSPASRTVSVPPDAIQQDFLGTAQTLKYSISGGVADSTNNAISGVSISDGAGHSTTTDSNGNYILTGLTAGTYAITPFKTGYSFSPSSANVTVPPNAAGRNFTGTLTSVDIGFRPFPNGYSFSNSDSSWGWYPNPPAGNDFTLDDLRHMFGDAFVCESLQGSTCLPKFSARVWMTRINIDMRSGHCDGMASTSLRFFKGLDNPSRIQPGANSTYDLHLDNARRNIAYYFVEQYTGPVREYKEQVRQETPSVILQRLQSAMLNGAPDPVTLFVRQVVNGQMVGHAVIPYAIQDRGNGVFWVRVYDNNYPEDVGRHVEINTANDNGNGTWSYDGLGSWTGSSSSHTLGVVPISLYGEQPWCPSWCAEGSTSSLSPKGPSSQEVWLTGQGHLLITDSQGRRFGYVGSQFVSEIPGAYATHIDTGTGTALEPLYDLPLTSINTILIDGQTLTQTRTVAITQFGPGYAISVDDVNLSPTTRDHLAFAPDGKQVSYRSDTTKPVTLTLAIDGAGQGNQFQIKGLSIGAGRVITTLVDAGQGKLVLNNSEGSSSFYTLNMTRVNSGGTYKFAHSEIPISATDTQYVVFGPWTGIGSVTLEIDQGSRGAISQRVMLGNQVFSNIFLPFLRR